MEWRRVNLEFDQVSDALREARRMASKSHTDHRVVEVQTKILTTFDGGLKA
jgi:hypothetical protein